MRVGLLGGTFDPIHLGHLAAADAALDCASLDQVLLVPAGNPPHKELAHASAGDRLEMCRLAVGGKPRLGVWEWEVGRDGPSYTVETLREFHRERPGDEAFLVLGWDAARDLAGWHQPEQVLALARLVIIARPGVPPPSETDLRAAGIDLARSVLCAIRTPDVAATRIRALAERGESMAGLVPGPVEALIRRRGLYGARAQGR